jgi:hypothetical protein
MFNFAIILFLVSPIAFLAGLVNPKWVLRGEKRTRLKSSLLYSGVFVGSFLTIGLTAPPQAKNASVPSPSASPSAAASPVVGPSVAASPQPQEPTIQAVKQVSLTSSPVASGALPTQSQFNFPKATCGDKSTGANDTWYPVFVDRGDLETIRRNFCADATSTLRKDSKVEAVQVASFISRDQALEFAQAVGGDVGQPTYPDVASPSPQQQTEKGGSPSVASNEAVLTASDSDSQINIRATPSTTGDDLGYGLVGDRVEVIEQTTTDRYTWHKVRFPRSGAVGWIRGDFVTVVSANKTPQPSSEDTTYSSNPEVTTYAAPTTATSGSCNSPDDLDSSGRRCGGRAKGARGGRKRH